MVMVFCHGNRKGTKKPKLSKEFMPGTMTAHSGLFPAGILLLQASSWRMWEDSLPVFTQDRMYLKIQGSEKTFFPELELP